MGCPGSSLEDRLERRRWGLEHEIQRPELKIKTKRGGMLRNALLSKEEGDLRN